MGGYGNDFKQERAGAVRVRGKLKGIDWADVPLDEALLTGSDLEGAYMAGSHLKGADLNGSDLYWATLAGSDLSGANLTDCGMRGTILTDVNLRSACLHGADLRCNNLGSPALVDGTDLTGADLSKARLEGAQWDERTRFPAGFLPEAFGMVRR